jgi:serine/threonine-protein kinase RsbW
LDENKHIHFCCWLSPRKIRVEITDEGSGFDPERLPDCTDAAHISRPCGRGVKLMRAFMSHIEFHQRGNQVVLEKVRGA